jgi:hypothetical protein
MYAVRPGAVYDFLHDQYWIAHPGSAGKAPDMLVLSSTGLVANDVQLVSRRQDNVTEGAPTRVVPD